MKAIVKDKIRTGLHEVSLYTRGNEGYCLGIDFLRNRLADRQILLKMSDIELIYIVIGIFSEFPDIKEKVLEMIKNED